MANRKYTSLPYTEYVVEYGRYDESRAPIDRIVLHTMVGTVQSTRALFASFPPVGKETSAHYGIGYDGKIDAYSEEYYTAYHCGNYAFNQRSIGIEHEDMGNYNSPRPDALYETSAKLVADICKFYNIPCDSTHIFRHHDVPGSSTACPDALDTNRIISSAKQILAGGTTPTPPPMDDIHTKIQVQFDKACIELNKAGLAPTPAHEFWFDNPQDPDKFVNMVKRLIRDAQSSQDTWPVKKKKITDYIAGL